jgi:hypothetical protein
LIAGVSNWDREGDLKQLSSQGGMSKRDCVSFGQSAEPALMLAPAIARAVALAECRRVLTGIVDQLIEGKIRNRILAVLGRNRCAYCGLESPRG